MLRLLEYILFAVLVMGNLALGLYFSFRKRNLVPGSTETPAEVFLGNRMMKTLPLAASSVASLFSSTGLVGYPAHYYAYGWHMAWSYLTPLLFIPVATHVFVPVLYRLRITSIFQGTAACDIRSKALEVVKKCSYIGEYIRLRFNATISLTACLIYIFLTQSVGAISIFAASLTLVTAFDAPFFWCNVFIGLSGTVYTAMGGLRGVVWTDCMQFFFILVAPTTVVSKVILDSLSSNSTVKPFSTQDAMKYIGNYKIDLMSDETIWSCFLGSSAMSIYRVCLDQVVAQRMLASRTMKEARRTACVAALLLVLFYFSGLFIGVALTIWFRGCDPALLGNIKSIDQILPYYVNVHLVHVPGFVGLFLAGIVSAATSWNHSFTDLRRLEKCTLYEDSQIIAPILFNTTIENEVMPLVKKNSTVSSTLNSQAAILYVDVIAYRYKNTEKNVLWITRGTVLGLGISMTVYSTLCVHMGSVTRAFLMVYNGITAPFVGLCLLAVLFPFVHSKGAAVATFTVVVYQIIHIFTIIQSGRKAPRMESSLDYCFGNESGNAATSNITFPLLSSESQQPSLTFRISYLWASFFAIFATIIIGVLVSAATGETKYQNDKLYLCNDFMIRIWRQIGLMQDDVGTQDTNNLNADGAKQKGNIENENLISLRQETTI